MRFSLLAVVAVLVLSGCNTYHEGVYQKIMVRTPGVDNANCDLYTDTNRYAVMTSRQVVVERSDLPITVICRKTGYYAASVIVDPKTYDPYEKENIANGYVGVAIDKVSNSIYQYPDTITVILLPMPPQQLPQEQPYITKKKSEPVKKAHKDAASAAAADKALSESGKK